VAGLPALVLLLAPIVVREPLGDSDWERLTDPLERRVASLLAGEPVVVGIVTVVPLYARVPSEAGHGRPATIFVPVDELAARFVVDDGGIYLRVSNPTDRAMLVTAGTIFARGPHELVVARDAVIPPQFAALVPARPYAASPPEGDVEFRRAGLLSPGTLGSLLLHHAAFEAAKIQWRELRKEENFVPVFGHSAVRSRRMALQGRVKRLRTEFGSTAVGAVLLVGERPVAAHVFATHDLFIAALPDLLQGLAVAARDEEIFGSKAFALRRQAVESDAKGRAIAWLRHVARAPEAWRESYGAGFETVVVRESVWTIGHAVVDQRRALVHAGFYVPDVWPQALAGAPPPGQPPDLPPVNPDEEPPGFRERRARPTLEDQRRGELNPNSGPADGGAQPGGRTPPDGSPPGNGGGGQGALGPR